MGGEHPVTTAIPHDALKLSLGGAREGHLQGSGATTIDWNGVRHCGIATYGASSLRLACLLLNHAAGRLPAIDTRRGHEIGPQKAVGRADVNNRLGVLCDREPSKQVGHEVIADVG